MKALSIRQPWVWAILHAGKRVENRDWKHMPSFRGPILIHASKGCTGDEWEGAAFFMRGIARMPEGSPWPKDVTRIPTLAALPRGALVARARLVDVVRITEQGHREHPGDFQRMHCPCGALPPWAGGERWTAPCAKPDPWAIPGALGLILDAVEPLAEPIPFKGALGFFEVPDELLARGAA